MTTRRAPWLAALGALLLVFGTLPAAEPEKVKAAEQALRDAKVGTDGPALLDFFRKRTLSASDRDKILGLIKKLGDDEFQVREAASTDLVAFGQGAASLLRQAMQTSEDIEIVRRCERCLETIDKEARVGLPAAAARVMAARKPDGAAAVLLAYLPFADTEPIADEVRTALAAVALRDGQPDPTLAAALEDKDVLRRAAAVQALIRASRPEQRQNLAKFLQDADTTVRFQAVLAFFEVHDKRSVPAMIALLTELPLEKGYVLEELLCRVGGDDSPQAALSKAEGAAKKCQTAWQGWWAKNADKVDLSKPPPLLEQTLVVEWNQQGLTGRVRELDRDGKEMWKIDNLARPIDAVVLPNDRVAIAEYTNRRVVMRTLKGDEVWQKQFNNFITGLQRLHNGNLLVVLRNQVVELDRDGKDVATYTRGNADIFSAQRLRNGGLLVVTRNGQCIHLDADGKEEKSFQIPGGLLGTTIFGSVDLLPNGRVVAPVGQQNKVVEVDDQGKVVWEASFTMPNVVQRLPNGHTLVTSYSANRAAELDRDGKEVSTITGDGRLLRVRKR